MMLAVARLFCFHSINTTVRNVIIRANKLINIRTMLDF